MNEHVTVEGALAEIARTLSRMTDPGSTLIELGLSGLLFGCDADELIRIDKACARFLYARVDRTGLRPAPADNSWLEKLPAGLVRVTADRLRTVAATPGPDSEVATQALLELYSMASEVPA